MPQYRDNDESVASTEQPTKASSGRKRSEGTEQSTTYRLDEGAESGSQVEQLRAEVEQLRAEVKQFRSAAERGREGVGGERAKAAEGEKPQVWAQHEKLRAAAEQLRVAAEQQKLRVTAEQEKAWAAAMQEKLRAVAEQEMLRVAEETNAVELDVVERALHSVLRQGEQYLRAADQPPVYIGDILKNYAKLRGALDTLALGQLWPCVLTSGEHSPLFSAPLDVPPDVATMLIALLREASSGELPFPSAPAVTVQLAIEDERLARAQPYFLGPTHRLIGLPAENAEAGFVRGAKLDTEVRIPFSSPDHQVPPTAFVAAVTRKPNRTVVCTHGYFRSTLAQFGVSTPATASIAYGYYDFGLEIGGVTTYQNSLVTVPDQLTVSLVDLEPEG